MFLILLVFSILIMLVVLAIGGTAMFWAVLILGVALGILKVRSK